MKRRILLIIGVLLLSMKGYALDVMMVIPVKDDVNVPLDTEVSVTFDNEVTLSDVLGITIMPETKNVSVNIDGTRLNISHDDFEPNTKYTVYIPYGVVNDYDHFGILWSFTTGNYTDESIVNENNE